MFCFASLCKEANTVFCFVSWYKEANLLPIIDLCECLLMFLLNVLLDLTDELDVLYRSFATQNTSASLYSILIYQIKFPPPRPTH